MWRYLFCLLLAGCGRQQDWSLMLGPVEAHSAIVWLDAPRRPGLQLRFADTQGSGQWQRPQPVFAADATQHFRLAPLQAAHTYRYQLYDPETGQVLTEQRLQAAAEKAGVLDVLLGSCAYLSDWPGSVSPIFGTMASHAKQQRGATLMLWLGDNLYFRDDDLVSPAAMLARYRKQRAVPALSALLQAVPNYAIWDDWDFGGNDSSKQFPGRAASAEVFRAMWPRPEAGQGDPQGKGMYYRFRRGDVEFFMLDDRTYRDADISPDQPGKAMFGEQQIQWLQQGLLQSRARFKLIVSGSSLLNAVRGNEGWHNFQRERLAFFSWLMAHPVDGIVLISGDAHHTRLTVNNRVAQQPLYELTCSPLSASVEAYRSQALMPGQRNLFVVNQNNYCQLAFRHDAAGQATLTFAAIDESGKQLAHYSAYLAAPISE